MDQSKQKSNYSWQPGGEGWPVLHVLAGQESVRLASVGIEPWLCGAPDVDGRARSWVILVSFQAHQPKLKEYCRAEPSDWILADAHERCCLLWPFSIALSQTSASQAFNLWQSLATKCELSPWFSFEKLPARNGQVWRTKEWIPKVCGDVKEGEGMQ